MSARVDGRALVLLKDRSTYRATVQVDSRFVHCTATDLRRGAYDDVWYRPVGDKAIPISRVHEIRWLDEAAS
jgi:hypothetical protein